ncbi:hypothetical protein [Streptococcus pneumoniae]|uniref:hypothetical protein n=1 Tax=Streptococcus pneumoniae TaxID=1313 RepID=UPI000A7FDA5D|nr:hypothetical protein [Streptococcus pneumoniae]
MMLKTLVWVADRTDEVSSKHWFEVVDKTDKSAQSTALRLQMKLTSQLKTLV